MLIWSPVARRRTVGASLLLVAVIYGLPAIVIVLASLAGQWNGVLPSAPTLRHYANIWLGDSSDNVYVSVATAVVASVLALINGTWAALSLRYTHGRVKSFWDLWYYVPSAVPSVSVGLALLVSFSHPPLVLNGTATIVFVAHFILVSSFCYGNVSAGLKRLPSDFESMAESLGAGPAYRFIHVTLPLLLPYLSSAFSLCFALSMGELGATIMLYPPGWVTLPVTVFALSDRGAVFDAAALTVVLGLISIVVLMAVSWLSHRLSGKR